MSRGIALASYALMAVIFATPVAAQVVALGASNTEGYGVGSVQAYPSQLERMLRARGLSVSVRNAGVSGNTTAQMLARLDSAVPAGTRLVLSIPAATIGCAGSGLRSGRATSRPSTRSFRREASVSSM